MDLTEQFRLALKASRVDQGARPGRLFHYTTAAGFEGIVSSASIRATNFSFMNDPLELEYGRRLIHEHLTERLATSTGGVAGALFRHCLEELDRESGSEIYVSCFSSSEDDLSQWRAYGNTSARYALGFERRVIHAATLRPRSYSVRFSRVVYERGKQNEILQKLLDGAETFVKRQSASESAVPTFGDILSLTLTRMLPTLKMPAFKPEAEWRIIIQMKPGDTSNLHFDTSRGIVRPFAVFPISEGQPLPLAQVIVLWPSRPEAAVKAARLVLLRAGIALNDVRYSEVPFAE